ncbi:MAG TPA: hypothetical protein VK543_02620, partial [Puia sp.]|nr:hypothetical protein [Puia sp.]
IVDQNLTIAADTFLTTAPYRNFVRFRKYRQAIANGESINTDSLVASNPEFYHAYVLAGDYQLKHKEYQQALQYYRLALTKVIATKKEEDYIRKRIEELEGKK